MKLTERQDLLAKLSEKAQGKAIKARVFGKASEVLVIEITSLISIINGLWEEKKPEQLKFK